jgi:hypothetical protein
MFGPEWKKNGSDYVRDVEIKAKTTAGTGINYTFPLFKGNSIHLFESWEDRHIISAECGKRGLLLIENNKDDKPEWHIVHFGDVSYIDVNGDGLIDLMYDNRIQTNKWFMFFGGEYIRIEDPSRSLNSRPIMVSKRANSAQSTEVYTFEGATWRPAKPEDYPDYGKE